VDEPPLHLPDLDLGVPARSPAAPKARVNNTLAESGTQAAAEPPSVAHLRADDLVGQESPRRRPSPKPASSTTPAHSRGFALVELLAGAGAVYLGVHLESSIFTGDGTWLSIIAHGFALYGIGAGVVGLRP
jgi:hypothetical protein